MEIKANKMDYLLNLDISKIIQPPSTISSEIIQIPEPNTTIYPSYSTCKLICRTTLIATDHFLFRIRWNLKIQQFSEGDAEALADCLAEMPYVNLEFWQIKMCSNNSSDIQDFNLKQYRQILMRFSENINRIRIYYLERLIVNVHIHVVNLLLKESRITRKQNFRIFLTGCLPNQINNHAIKILKLMSYPRCHFEKILNIRIKVPFKFRAQDKQNNRYLCDRTNNFKNRATELTQPCSKLQCAKHQKMSLDVNKATKNQLSCDTKFDSAPNITSSEMKRTKNSHAKESYSFNRFESFRNRSEFKRLHRECSRSPAKRSCGASSEQKMHQTSRVKNNENSESKHCNNIAFKYCSKCFNAEQKPRLKYHSGFHQNAPKLPTWQLCCKYFHRLGNRFCITSSFKWDKSIFNSIILRILLIVFFVTGGGHASPLVPRAAGGGDSETIMVRYQIREESPAGTEIGDLRKNSQLREKIPSTVLPLVKFQLLAESGGMFELEGATGVIRSSVVIDRDAATLCRQKETCVIQLDVITHPPQYLHIIRVTVDILDINDSPPRFRESHIYLPVSEAAQLNSVYVLPSATDDDSPRFGVQRYELESTSTTFGLVSEGLDRPGGYVELRLVLRERLDREERAQYRLRLVSYDSEPSIRGHTGVAVITVNVLDSNDNKPTFTRDQYLVDVKENTPIGSVLLSVQATDLDTELNGQIVYGFAPQTQDAHGILFGVRNESGEIYVKGELDHEKNSVYQLILVARDLGAEPYSSQTTVIVQIEDVNDNAPNVLVHTLGSSSEIAELPENSTIGAFVAHVTVNDPDSSDNGRVECSLSDQTFALQRKYATEYQIVTAAELDRERVEQYTLLLRCQDGAGTPSGAHQGAQRTTSSSRVTEKVIRVVVTDVNDNSPVFSQQNYKGSIIENNYIGASVMQVTATDWDDKENSRIEYSILGNLAWQFHVNQRGVISAHTSIDREKYEKFSFPILAIDMGNPRRTGSALVVIVVEDVNDERPKFLEKSFTFSVPENEPPGTSVGTVMAEDRDGPAYNRVGYRFDSNQNLIDTLLGIDSGTGLITLRRPLDREERGQYRFIVVAYDAKAQSLSSTTLVTLNVLDVNDNKPEFTHTSSGINNTVIISNRTPVGHVITQITAQDRDSDINAKLDFHLAPLKLNSTDRRRQELNQDASELFRINPESGAISVASSLHWVEVQTFPLIITVSDNGIPSLSCSTEFRIVVNKTIVFGSPASSLGHELLQTTYGFILIILGCSAMLVVFITLITAVILIRKRDQRKRQQRKYNNRMEALRMLTAGDGNHAGPDDQGQGPGRTVLGDQQDSSPDVSPMKGHQNGGLTVPYKSSSSDLTEHLNNIRGMKANGDLDKISQISATSSHSDSGRGMSEDCGDIQRAPALQRPGASDRYLPPPPPPPRGAYWLMQQQQPAQGRLHAGPGAANRFHSDLSTTPEEICVEYISPNQITGTDPNSTSPSNARPIKSLGVRFPDNPVTGYQSNGGHDEFDVSKQSNGIHGNKGNSTTGILCNTDQKGSGVFSSPGQTRLEAGAGCLQRRSLTDLTQSTKERNNINNYTNSIERNKSNVLSSTSKEVVV